MFHIRHLYASGVIATNFGVVMYNGQELRDQIKSLLLILLKSETDIVHI